MPANNFTAQPATISDIKLYPSRCQSILFYSIAILAVISIPLSNLSVSGQVALFTILGIYILFARKRLSLYGGLQLSASEDPNSPQTISVYQQGSQQWLDLQLKGEQVILPFLVVIQGQEMHKHKRHCIAVFWDSTDSNSLRFLRKYLLSANCG